jgi:hypothetical protein
VHAIPTGYRWEDVGADLQAWLVDNHTAQPIEGTSNHVVTVCHNAKKGPLDLDVTLQSMHLPGGPGSCFIGRKNMPKNLRRS